jgi:hypothetical protein
VRATFPCAELVECCWSAQALLNTKGTDEADEVTSDSDGPGGTRGDDDEADSEPDIDDASFKAFLESDEAKGVVSELTAAGLHSPESVIPDHMPVTRPAFEAAMQAFTKRRDAVADEYVESF